MNLAQSRHKKILESNKKIQKAELLTKKLPDIRLSEKVSEVHDRVGDIDKGKKKKKKYEKEDIDDLILKRIGDVAVLNESKKYVPYTFGGHIGKSPTFQVTENTSK